MAEKKGDVNSNPKNSIIDIAADLIGNSGINLDTVVDIAANAMSGTSSKKSGSSKKKKSKSDSLITKLISEEKDYPQFSEKTYWSVRDKFQESIPEKVIASLLTSVTGLKADTIKKTVLPALELMGLLNDGKPTKQLKAWANDDKYKDACASICDLVYPSSLKKLDFNTKTQQEDVIKWFKKNAGVSEATAKKMMAIYMLLAAPELKKKAETKKSASAAKKQSTSKDAADSVKVTKKGGKATITVKIVADEDITKKALTERFAEAAAEAYRQIR